MILLSQKPLFIFLAVILFTLSTACSKDEPLDGLSSAEKLIEVNACTSSISANSVFLEYTLQNNLFEKHGLDVTIHVAEGGSNAAKGLISGSYDICYIGGAAIANAALAGADVLIVSGMISQLPYVLVTLPEISDPQQLKNQPLAVSEIGSSSDTALRIALENIGLNPDEDVIILPIGGQSIRMAALESGSVIGTVVSVPESARARELDYNVMLDLADTNTPYQHSTIATRSDVVLDDREMVIRFLRAVTESISLMRTDRQGTYEALASYLLLDPEEDLAYLEEAHDVLVLKYYDPYLNMEGIELLIELAKVDNPTAMDVSAQDIVDESFIAELESTGYLDSFQR